MRPILQVISWLALAATILPSVIFFADKLGLDRTKQIMLAATVVWFVITPFWMGRTPEQHDEHQTVNG